MSSYQQTRPPLTQSRSGSGSTHKTAYSPSYPPPTPTYNSSAYEGSRPSLSSSSRSYTASYDSDNDYDSYQSPQSPSSSSFAPSYATHERPTRRYGGSNGADPSSYPHLKGHSPQAPMTFDMSILTISPKKDLTTVKAVIVGGGIAGLAIAIMMDLAGMEYEILERSTGQEIPMGVAISLGPPVLRLIEQMGLLDQVERHSKEVTGLTIVNGESRKLGRIEGLEKDRYGYPARIIGHTAFHQILLNRVKKLHLHRGKLVVETLQNPNGVSVKCSDGSTYYGDIIIGADGAASITREKMYVQLKEQGKLPEADMEYSSFEHANLGGVTAELDPRIYPSVKDAGAEFTAIFSKDKSYSMWYLPLPGNRVGWGISHQVAPRIKKHPYSHADHPMQPRSAAASTPYERPPRTSGSGSSLGLGGSSSTTSFSIAAAAAANATHGMGMGMGAAMPPVPGAPSMSRSSSSNSQPTGPLLSQDWMVPLVDNLEDRYSELMDMRCALGVGTVRDFIRQTPANTLTCVDLEERNYKTWHHGRIVLIGDACHHHLVIGGQGATQALLDCVCLVNLLYDMEFTSPQEISKVFKKYHLKRTDLAKTSIEEVNSVDKMFHGTSMKAGIMRKIMFNTLWSFGMKNDKFNNNRPQLSFLPFVKDRGHSKANKQKVSARITRNKACAV